MARIPISEITYEDNTYILKNAVLLSATFENVIASANDVNNGIFYFGAVLPNNWDQPFRIRYRIRCYCPSNLNYNQYADMTYFGCRSTITYLVHNNIYSTSYRSAYYHNMYKAKTAGVSAGYGHALGFSIYYSTNPTSASYKRTIYVEILEMNNCTFEFYDNCVIYASIPGTGSTNYDARVDFNWSGNSVYPDSNSDTYNRIRVDSRLSTSSEDSVKMYSLCYKRDDDTLESLTSTSGNNTTKTWNTDAKIPYPIQLYYYSGNKDVAVKTLLGTATLYSAISNIDMRYSANVSDTVGFTINKPLYLECAFDTNGYITIADNPYKQTFTKGKYYILIGWVYTNIYTISLLQDHPMYYYNGSKLIPVEQKLADDKYLPLTGGTVTGDLVVKSNSGTNGFYVSRLGSTTQESVKHWIDDNSYHIDYTNDEVSSNIIFKMVNTDTESGGSASASTQTVTFAATKDGSTITATNFVGKGSSLTNLNASNISSGTLSADRLPTSGVTAGSYGPASNVSPAHGGTFSVPYVTVDNKGRVTAASTKTITLPAQYVHPTYTSKTSGLYKITVDGTGHVSATAAVTASDLPEHTHNYIPNTKEGLYTAINLLDVSEVTPGSDQMYVVTAQASNQGEEYFRRPIGVLWDYFKTCITLKKENTGSVVSDISYDSTTSTLTVTKSNFIGTDEYVRQTSDTTTNRNYPILAGTATVSGTASDSKYNPNVHINTAEAKVTADKFSVKSKMNLEWDETDQSLKFIAQ